jgi:hypothetical protein
LKAENLSTIVLRRETSPRRKDRRPVPIRHLLESVPSLRPGEFANAVAAFDGALVKLGLRDRDDPATLMVAYRIIELVKDGERDPVRLRDAAEKSLTSDS